jgi:hypothetical protein
MMRCADGRSRLDLLTCMHHQADVIAPSSSRVHLGLADPEHLGAADWAHALSRRLAVSLSTIGRFGHSIAFVNAGDLL